MSLAAPVISYEPKLPSLQEIASNYRTTKASHHDCHNYMKHYSEHFAPHRLQRLRILEIGVQAGESLKMWGDYFPNSSICGLDISDTKIPADFDRTRFPVYIGDQLDKDLLAHITTERGPFDIIIDDGGHEMHQQIGSFNFLFEHSLADPGIYVIEDLHTSYWERFGGRNPITQQAKEGDNYTTIEYLQSLVHAVNYRSWRGDRRSQEYVPPLTQEAVSFYETHIDSITFHASLCFIRKSNNRAPF